MGRPLRLAAGAAALTLTACGIAIPVARPEPPAPQIPPATTPGCPSAQGQLVLEAINEIRREHGLGALRAEERLAQAALVHTADQAARGAAGVGHIGSDDSAPGDRVSRAGYEWIRVAENVAAGMATARAVVSGWMSSPPHRATILSPEAVHAGVGYVSRLDGHLNHYWTLVVATPRDPARTRVLACHP